MAIGSFGLTHARFTSSAGNLHNTFAAATHFIPPIAQTLVINEVLSTIKCGTSTKNQWIEIWNGYANPINLQDWFIEDGANPPNKLQIVNSNTSLPAHQFALLSKDGSTWSSCYKPVPSGVVTAQLGGQIDINTGVLRLLDNQSHIIDRIEFGTASARLNSLAGQSIERKILGEDSATGDTFNANDFTLRYSPTAGFALPQIQTVVINEFLPHPISGSDWIELYNSSSSAQSIASWKLIDSTGGIIATLSGSLAPHTWTTRDVSNRLNNGGDTVELIDNGGVIQDIFYYFSDPGIGVSIGRYPDGNNTWGTFSIPTEGIINGVPTTTLP